MGIPQYNEPSDDVPQVNSAEVLVQRFGRLNILDDLIRLRATDVEQVPILAYPKPSQDGYEYFTGEDLDCMVDQAVCALMELGIRPVSPSREQT
jgi:hypothetical protein